MRYISQECLRVRQLVRQLQLLATIQLLSSRESLQYYAQISVQTKWPVSAAHITAYLRSVGWSIRDRIIILRFLVDLLLVFSMIFIATGASFFNSYGDAAAGNLLLICMGHSFGMKSYLSLYV